MNLPFITDTLGNLVLVLLALSTVLTVLDAIGLLPAFFAKWLARNRLSHTVAVLRELGWNPVRGRRAFELSKLQHLVPFARKRSEATLIRQEADLNTSVRVGRIQVVDAETFIDVMGKSADHRFAERTARTLAARWRELAQEGTVDPAIDGVAGLKTGSPFVAYELARQLKVPLLLHVGAIKFDRDPPILQMSFDTMLPSIAELRFLVVDDSTTGGTKAMNAIREIRDFGGIVDTMLVLFVPPEKEPVTLLKQIEVQLYSAIPRDV
ncbi:MAG: phosphoribosyltransferase [Aurantimonas coralicida]